MERWKDLPLEEKLKIEVDDLPLSKGVIKMLKKKGIYILEDLYKNYKTSILRPYTHAEKVYWEVTQLGLAMDILERDNPDVFMRYIPKSYLAGDSKAATMTKERALSYLGVPKGCIETLINRIKRRNREFGKIRSAIIKYAGRSGFSAGDNYS